MRSLKHFLNENAEMGENPKLKKAIIKLVRSRPDIDDETIHKFAERIGWDPDRFEEEIYKVLHLLLKNAPGKHIDVPDEKFDPVELGRGIEVEKEHTDCPMIAKEVAKDHLAEIPDYYTRLDIMEKQGEKAKEGE